MKNVISALLLFSSMVVSGVSNAAGEIESWYKSEGGEYLVRDSIHGELHSQLSTSKVGNISVYLFYLDSSCEGKNSDVVAHDPLLINDKLVRYLQYCDGSRRYFFPATTEGRNYLINEFIKRDFVEIKTYNKDFSSLFSAKGFTKLYNQMKAKEEAI